MSRTGGSVYRRNREKLRGQQLPCHLCGKAIDYRLIYPDPQSFSADHLKPVGNGGDNNAELKASHLLCNKRRSDKEHYESPELRTSREW